MFKSKLIFLVIMISLFSSKLNASYEKLAFDFSFKDLDGSEMKLADFKNKVITYTNFRIERDLDSWVMNLAWTPFGARQSWFFFIGVRSGFLSDLKYDKRREPDKRL